MGYFSAKSAKHPILNETHGARNLFNPHQISNVDREYTEVLRKICFMEKYLFLRKLLMLQKCIIGWRCIISWWMTVFIVFKQRGPTSIRLSADQKLSQWRIRGYQSSSHKQLTSKKSEAWLQLKIGMINLQFVSGSNLHKRYAGQSSLHEYASINNYGTVVNLRTITNPVT